MVRKILTALAVMIGLLAVPRVAEANIGDPCNILAPADTNTYWVTETTCGHLDGKYMQRASNKAWSYSLQKWIIVKGPWVYSNWVRSTVKLPKLYYSIADRRITVCKRDGTSCWYKIRGV